LRRPLLATTLSSLPALAAEPAAVRYALCPRNIAKVTVEQRTRQPGFTLNVILQPEAAEDFKQLTEKNLKNFVEVWFDGALLERARVMAPTGAGQLILGSWQDREAAERVKAMLADSRLSVPCGVMP
jgi:hypothetical protein